jgi:type IV pilus assembly protein PilN
MIRINLLPTKAARKRDTAKQEFLGCVGGLILLFGGIYLFHSSLAGDAEELDTKIAQVKAEIARLSQDVVRVEEFKKQAATLESKIVVIRGLQSKRINPAHLLDDLATIVNEQEKVWLTKVVETQGKITLEGGAMEHENISDFQLALERQSKLISNVRLSSVKSASVDGHKILQWQIIFDTSYRAG